MTEMTAIAKSDQPRPRKGKLSLVNKPAPAAKAAAPAADVKIIIPSSPQPVALSRLRRAPENVRHTRIDEDVVGMADDITAHGLLSSLIGYQGQWPDDSDIVYIVGGGRRYQALSLLEERGNLDSAWPVPVLIRDQGDALELSLAENLQQRTMSPVDEFFAFKALIDLGTGSPRDLAKRFGFTERVVKQRLRLAELAPEILDTLAARDMTLDQAMAYASSQDQDLQREVFKSEKKRSWDPHRISNIRHTLSMKAIKTDSPIFKFVGAESYELRGGTYDDDLFVEVGAEKTLATPGIAQTAAGEMIDFQMDRLLKEFQERADLSPTIVGHLVAPDLRIKPWGNDDAKITAPAGFVRVNKYDPKGMWKTIRNTGIPVYIMVGIDNDGALVVYPKSVFVPKAQRDAIDPPQNAVANHELTPEDRARLNRERGIEVWSRRLAIGQFAGTPFEGRGFWPNHYCDHTRPHVLDGVKGWLVTAEIFASDQDVAAQLDAAAAAYDDEIAARAAAVEADKAKEAEGQRRMDELLALDPSPAVVVIDGEPWGMIEDGAYAVIGDDEGGHVPSWTALLANFDIDDVGQTFATREDFDAVTPASAIKVPA